MSNKGNKYKFISENSQKLLDPLLKNKNLLKLLKYTSNDPLSEGDVDIETVIDDGTNNPESIIYLDIFNPKIAIAEKISVYFSPYKSAKKYSHENIALGKFLFTLDVAIPHEYFVLRGQGKFRAWEIAYEIAKSIDQQEVAGIGKVLIESDNLSRSDGYRILELTLSVENVVFSDDY